MSSVVRRAGLFLGPLAWLVLGFVETPLTPATGTGSDAAVALGLVLWMAIWWLTEAVPMGWTAVLPLPVLLAFPLAGRGRDESLVATASAYLDAYIFLFLGGLAIAAALERWNLHRRLALFVLSLAGTAPERILLGVLCSTAFVSLWISNTASAALMLPIALALARELEQLSGGKRLDRYGCALMLAVAYGANLGGMGTKIGTAPNALLGGFLEREAGIELSFVRFSMLGAPLVLFLLPLAWAVLWWTGRGDAPKNAPSLDSIRASRVALGPWSTGERRVGAIFLGAAALWIVSAPLTGLLREHGAPATMRSAHVEAGVALAAFVLLLLVRANGRPLLAFSALRTLSWSTLLLLGGSLALADAIQNGGLSQVLAAKLTVLGELPLLVAVFVAAATSTLISALASNTATVSVLLPVLWSAADPERATIFVCAAAFAASCDFALPAGTPPNAIVFGSGYVTVPRMARAGIVLDLLAALVCAAWCALAVRFVV